MGTTISVYPRRMTITADVAPGGTAVTTAVVAADRTTTLTGLTDGERYWAVAAALAGRPKKAIGFAPADRPFVTGYELDTAEAVSTALDTRVDTIELTGAVRPTITSFQYVDPTNGDDDNDGLSEGTAKSTITAALADLHATKGGDIILPIGSFTTADRIDAAGRHNIRLKGRGRGGLSGGFGTTLIFSGTGSDPFIDASETYGFVIEDMEVIYTSSSFTGDLVNLDNSSGSGANDTNQASVDRVFLGAQPTNTMTARSLISLDNTHTMTFRSVVFAGAEVAVFGKSDNNNYANTIRFEGCLFLNYQDVAHVKNADGAWSFAGCSFQQLNDGSAGTLVQESGIEARGVTFDACWFGDVSDGSGQQILWEGHGLNIRGCRLGVETAGAKVVVINANNTRGIVIQGNVCKGPGGPLLDFGSTTGHIGVLLGPNYIADLSAATAGTIPAGLMHFDASSQLTIGGDVSLLRDAASVLRVPAMRVASSTGGIIGSLTNGLTLKGNTSAARIGVDDTGLGFFNTAPVAKQTVTGSRGANAALASLLDALEAMGLITDSSSA